MVDCERRLEDVLPGAYLPLRNSAAAPHSSGDLPGRPVVRRTSGMEAGARRWRGLGLGAALASWSAAREKTSRGNVGERIMMMGMRMRSVSWYPWLALLLLLKCVD